MPELVGTFSHLGIAQFSESHTSLKRTLSPHFNRIIEKNKNPMQQLEEGKIYVPLHCTSFITSFYIKIYKQVTANSQ